MRGVFLGDLPQASRSSYVPHYPRLNQKPVSIWPSSQGGGGHYVFALALILAIFSPPNSMMELLTECVFCSRKLK